jgi:hypothetical protein
MPNIKVLNKFIESNNESIPLVGEIKVNLSVGG